jgi:hypothetical protein
MRDNGLTTEEIALRIRRSPAHVERIISWTELPSRRSAPRVAAKAFERRVLALRADGESYEQIGSRFRRSAGFIKRVEGLAHYRLALELLA